jgi:hypothetical protein
LPEFTQIPRRLVRSREIVHECKGSHGRFQPDC